MDTSKIIKGVVGGGRYTVTAPIVKENYGIYLQIEGAELPETYQVDFSNEEHHGTSVTMIGNADGVLIPRQFIDTGKDIFAFLYHVGSDFGRTVYKFRIPNKVRPDRTNEEPTPEEQSTIDQAISALNEAVEQTAQDVIDADASAQSASADADRAEEARTDAQNYATQAEQAMDDAQTYANNASASATASAQSASQSAQIKADVEDLVDDAQASANASAQSATASANSASQAQGYAQSASGYASSAQSSAQTASNKASEASTSAQTASQKATEAAQSATNASQSAQTAESAKTASQTAQGLAESARDTAVSAKTDAESARDDAVQAKEDAESAVASIADALDDKAPIITDTASGSIASFSDGADDLPLKSLVVDINPVQDLSHGDPSPENICPISGWTQIDVNHSGADMTNPTTLTIQLGQTVYGGHLDVVSGELTIDRVCENYDGSESGWGLQSINSYGIANFIHNATYQRSGMFATICNMFGAEQTSGIATTTNEGYLISANLYIYIRLLATKADTVDKFREWLQLNPIQISYKLATPIEIQLTPQQVNSLLGVNNIWADSGDSTVEYRADTKLFIERLTAPDSADMIADANITSGQYFMVGNSLYKATANIANGSAIIVGTNAVRKSLSEALNEINA